MADEIKVTAITKDDFTKLSDADKSKILFAEKEAELDAIELGKTKSVFFEAKRKELEELTRTQDDRLVRTRISDLFGAIQAIANDSGAVIEPGADAIRIQSNGSIKPVDVTTSIYPGFPTDTQAQWMALMCLANGAAVITDTVFEDRFTHVAELTRFGADIVLDKNVAVVRGVPKLSGAHVMSTDLRASASLILAGLAAEGRTDVSRIYHIDRGYEHIETKLRSLGADISRDQEKMVV
jgi:UDP-N-acetylglucosamine 1-carboxyvinyltransferase